MRITVETLFDLSPALLPRTSCAKKVRIYIWESYPVFSPEITRSWQCWHFILLCSHCPIQGGTIDMPHLGVKNSFIFMQFTAENLQNNKLAHSLWELVSPQETPGSGSEEQNKFSRKFTSSGDWTCDPRTQGPSVILSHSFLKSWMATEWEWKCVKFPNQNRFNSDSSVYHYTLYMC